MKTETTNINLRIDAKLLKDIKVNAGDIGNSTTKEINEMLWLALKPRTEQIKKVLATRTSTSDQINNKTKPTHNKTINKQIDYKEWEKAEKETIDACNQICEDDL